MFLDEILENSNIFVIKREKRRIEGQNEGRRPWSHSDSPKTALVPLPLTLGRLRTLRDPLLFFTDPSLDATKAPLGWRQHEGGLRRCSINWDDLLLKSLKNLLSNLLSNSLNCLGNLFVGVEEESDDSARAKALLSLSLSQSLSNSPRALGILPPQPRTRLRLLAPP